LFSTGKIGIQVAAKGSRRIIMRANLIPVLAAAFCFSTACYKAVGNNLDAQTDPVGDSEVDAADTLPDNNCYERVEPGFQGLDYQEVVPARTPFTLTFQHEGVLEPTVAVEVAGSVLDAVLGGTVCLCGPCGPLESESSVTIDGLEAGEYTIRVQGESFPLSVVDDCRRSPLYVDPVPYGEGCAEETRINREHAISFMGSGSGCGCGGYVENSLSFDSPHNPHTGRLDITAVEVVCDPSLCCAECPCIDVYDVDLQVRFPEEGFYYNYANGEYVCYTAVFGEDGCSDWPSMWTEIVEAPSEVLYGTPVVIVLGLSSGFCCGEISPFVNEERDAAGNVTLSPWVTVCEGSCCYMCDCIDYTELAYEITDLTIGSHRICVSGETEGNCVEVFVYGYD
jgi:hypothetical protein